MALCTTTITLSPGISDNPMDGAIYHPTRNSFFTVRAGYITEYSVSLHIVNGPVKFAPSCFGRSCIAYDSVNDRIWCGTSGDWAAGYQGDPGGALPSKSPVGAYRIIPSTLATEGYIDPTTFQLDVTSNLIQNWSAVCGVTDVLVANGKLFGTFAGSGHISGFIFGCFGINLPANTVAWQGGSQGVSLNAQLAHDSSNQLWINGDWDLYFNDFPLYGPDAGAPTIGPATNPTAGAHCGIVFSPVAPGAIYVVQLPNTAMAKYNFTTGAKISEPLLVGASLGGMTSKIRFNSNDNLIYIPCPASNQMIAFNPATDTVAAIYTTGMDSPHDVVFGTGSLRVAVQQGSSGLNIF